MNSDFFKQRRAGILLHPTSLPGTPGNGDLGQHAYRFIDFLADSGISLWQMLPLGPPCEDLSPYQCQSVHAANSLLISLERLVEKGWLSEDASPYSEHELEQALQHLSQQGWHQEEHCETAMCYRLARLKEARTGFEKHASADNRTAFAEFIETQAYWLEDYGRR